MAASRSDRKRAEWRTPAGDLPSTSLNRIDTSTADDATRPLVAIVAADQLVARRIESLLTADGMLIEHRGQSIDEADAAFDVLVMTFGHGITVRDQKMRRIRKGLPRTQLVAVMPEDSRRGVRRALEAGADGVVFEPELEATLAPTIRASLVGQMAVPAARRHEIDRPTLSGREKQVLSMVVLAMSNKAIASELYLAESTIKCHLSSAFAKLGVRSRHEAADLILHSGADYGLVIVAVPNVYATKEGSEAMGTSHIRRERGVPA